jgi:hypothetical protein
MDDLLVTSPNSPQEKATQLVELMALQKQIAPKIQTLKEDLLHAMQENGEITGFKTKSYTITLAKRTTPQVINYKALKKSLEDAGIEVITEEVFAPQMDLVFKQAIEEGREFEGLESKVTEYVSVRVKEPERKEEL